MLEPSNILIRVLEPRCWNQGAGTEMPEPRCWNQAAGTKLLEPSCWNQDAGTKQHSHSVAKQEQAFALRLSEACKS
jgi:hypothetical protein